MPSRYEPKDHIQSLEIAPRAEGILDQREITVRSYKTTVPFNAKTLDRGLEGAWLSPVNRFGVFARNQPGDGKDGCAVVLGLQDALSVRAYDYDARRPLWYSWRDVIVDTVSVRYFKGEDGFVRFTTAGGGQRITDDKLDDFNSTFLAIPKEAVTKQQFDLNKLRDLCFRRFVDRLYMVRFSDPSGKEYESIDHASFQSRQYIDPATVRLNEVRKDKQAKIESFDSDIPVRSSELAEPAQVRFFLRGLRGSLRLRFPKLAYSRQCETPDAQARLFYTVVTAAVDSILDADYYAANQDSLQDLYDQMGHFPEMVDLARFSKVLSASKNREEFFQKLDMAAPRGEWLPHFHAVDGLLSSAKVDEHVRTLVAELTTRSPSTAVTALLACRTDSAMLRIGQIFAAVLGDRLQVVAPDVRRQAEDSLLAWNMDHEDASWDVDPEQGEITVRNLRWRMADLSLDVVASLLTKLLGLFHGRLAAARGDIGALLRRFSWCVAAARALPPNHSRLSPALRLLAEGRVPTSIAEGGRVLKAPPSDLPTLDNAVLLDFGLPLWPSFDALREDGQIRIRNSGPGVALALKASPTGTLFSDPDGLRARDVRPGEEFTLDARGNPSRVDIRFTKYGLERMAEILVVKTPKRTAASPGTSSAPDDPFGWVRQAELVRALDRVLAAEDSPHKSTLTRAVQAHHIQTNGLTGQKCLLQVDSVKAWLIKSRNMQHDETQQVVDAIVSEIRLRKR